MHIGHGFSILKTDINVRKHILDARLRGEEAEVLFPLGFHCTGMPIYSMAHMLREELDTKQQGSISNILQSMEISTDDLVKFCDPEYWARYFPERAMKDLQDLNLSIDWSRSFVTTSINPYYDSFVKWHMNKLKEMGKIVHGQRNSIFSLKDRQPCADHDRSSGEGVPIVEYTLYKYRQNNITVVYASLEPLNYPTSTGEIIKCMYKGETVYMSPLLSKNLIAQKHNIEVIGGIYEVLGAVTKESTIYNESLCRVAPRRRSVECEQISIGTVFLPSMCVISRSGDECIVALTDQWYICYSDPVWKQRVNNYITDKLCVPDPLKKKLLIANEWLQDWCCSRDYGLGTKFPFDDNMLVDSLSDSTIYMAYYTVCHLLHSDLYGQQPVLIRPEDLSDMFWDKVFLGKYLDDTELSAVVDKCRKEFLKWYPVDHRYSGKDLINNHLLMCLYNHIAIFGEDMTPLKYSVNGHVSINGKKMSKAAGNFITIKQLVKQQGSDVVRLSLADIGDTLDDANYDILSLGIIRDKLEKLSKYYMMPDIKTVSCADFQLLNVDDNLFYNQLLDSFKNGKQAYKEEQYHSVIKYGLHVMCRDLDKYLKIGANKSLIGLFKKLQYCLLCPIIPSFYQHNYQPLDDFDYSIIEPDTGLLIFQKYLHEIISNIRNQQQRAAKKNNIIKSIEIIVSPDREKLMNDHIDFIQKSIKCEIAISVNTSHPSCKYTFRPTM